MAFFSNIPAWKQAPFIRMLPPFAGGVLLQWFVDVPPFLAWSLTLACFGALAAFAFSPVATQFRYNRYSGFCIQVLIFGAGCLTANSKDVHDKAIRRLQEFPGSITPAERPINDQSPAAEKIFFSAVLQEPLTEKSGSWKAVASAITISKGNARKPVPGGILLYFSKKDNIKPEYGDRILFSRPVSEISGPANPAAFDYRLYCRFQQIYFQVWLRAGDFIIQPVKEKNALKSLLFRLSTWTRQTLSHYIKGDKERGLAEALLIGYKEDLDKNLLASYSTAGVVHVIAISGLHLGLIYGLLSFVCRPLTAKRRWRWLTALIIIAGLWLFSLLAGGSPSVLRSAVMFTAIVLGTLIARKTPLYNNLAASAFLLLCYQPYWLWDVGFQLSYAALASIVIFSKPIYQTLAFNNKILDNCWNLVAVTLAAQVLTTPVCLYYFHQFPMLFLPANLIAVPLSGIILMGELLLCAVSFIGPVAVVTGWIVERLIRIMNNGMEILGTLPFSVWKAIQLSAFQIALLYCCIIMLCVWWFYLKKTGLWIALATFVLFFTLRSVSFYRAAVQQKIVIYQVSGRQAIDFICGRRNVSLTDPEINRNPFLIGFHLQPARMLYRVPGARPVSWKVDHSGWIAFGNTRILLITAAGIDLTVLPGKHPDRQTIDLTVISGNPEIELLELLHTLNIRKVVIDGSNPLRKARAWKAICQSADIPCHLIVDKGAFVMNVN